MGIQYGRTKLAAFVAAAMLAAGPLAADAAEGPGDGNRIKMARATWDTGWFPAEVYKQMLEELGYEVPTVTTLDNPAFYQAVGQGDMDLWANGWFPIHNTYESAFQPGARKIGYVAKGGALQGYLVDKASIEKYDIKHLTDFKRPEVKEAFDTDGDGKAEMVACPPGWGCEEVISHHIEAYGLSDHVDPVKAGYSASMADALGRYKNGEPVFFYTWTPNWTVGLLKPGEDVMWITVKETRHPEGLSAEETTVQNLETCVENPCNLGWAASDIRPVANNDFLDANPAVETLLEVAHIPLGDIYAQNAKMFNGEDDPEDLVRHASEWIAANRDMVDGWMEKARAAAE